MRENEIIRGRRIGEFLNEKIIRVNSKFKDDLSEMKYHNPFEDQPNLE